MYGKERDYYFKVPEKAEIIKSIPPGYYDLTLKSVGMGGATPVLFKKEEDISKYAPLTENPYKRVASKIKAFFSDEIATAHKNLGLNHYLGVLCDGRPGSGKTGFSKSLAHNLITKERVVVMNINLGKFGSCGELVETLEAWLVGDTKILVIFDEFEKYGNFGTHPYFLNLLDGGSFKLNNVCFLFITNYAGSQLKDTLLKRPSRIEEQLNFTKLSEDLTVQVALSIFGKENLKGINLTPILEYVKKNDCSVDDVKAILKEHLIYSTPIEELLDINKRPTNIIEIKNKDQDDDDF